MQYGQSVGIGLTFKDSSFHLYISEAVIGETGVPDK